MVRHGNVKPYPNQYVKRQIEQVNVPAPATNRAGFLAPNVCFGNPAGVSTRNSERATSLPPPRSPYDAQETLAFRTNGMPGKFGVTPTNPLATQHDLSPHVLLALRFLKESAYTSPTGKGNFAAVMSNGAAIRR